MTRMDTCTPIPANYYVLQLRRAALAIQPIEIDEIAVGRFPALALILDSIVAR